MKEWVTDELVSAIRARCACGGKCTCRPSNEARAKFAEETYLPPARSQHAPTLRLVPNCGSLLKARTQPPRPSAA